ncbi:Importin-11 [Psilocybe cubensis]|uniref:Importin-11 n=2 Tax=Psilocybe cubensis TaxID=181762 RepID=A0ACB8H412_PSICU|nr:Importin-11 [Psilocybe cubensis]KAH9482382.1 Importin-11 [Psilocybe cubensis]
MQSVPRPIALGVNVQSVSPTELYEVIVGASSQDVSQIQSSSQRLKQLLDMFGAFDALQEIAARKTTPLVIRQQAMIQLKNTVTQHWRSRKLLSDEHRLRIRQRCLLFLDEEDDTIAKCNQIIVAKLARSDFPGQWPNLLDDLVNVIDGNLQKRYISLLEDPCDTLRLRRSLSLLNKILKEFASIKLPNGIKAMGLIVGQLRLLLYGYYSKMSATFAAQHISPQNISSQSLHDNILLSHLVYKCLIKMAVWLWNKLGKLSGEELEHNLAWVEELFKNSAMQVKALSALRKGIVMSLMNNELPRNEQTRLTVSVMTRHLRTFGKFFRRLQQLSSERFISLSLSGDIVMYYWSQIVDSTEYPQNMIADSDEALYPVRFLVQGLVLFKDNLSKWTPTSRSGVPNKNNLSQQFVESAVRLLVTRFMPLNTADLEGWMADPEEWVNLEDKDNDQWEYEIRACSERVLMQLCNQFSDIVVPLLAASFVQIAPQPSRDLDSVVQKEALYCAIGRCAIRLKNAIQLETWLQTTFIAEVHETDSNYPIIKRRIAWLIGKWVADSCISPNNPKIWEILVHLLQDRGPGTDAVVRLTAASSLRECVDSLSFDANGFAPFLATAIPQLIQIMAEAETLESKRKVDESLNTVIQQSGTLVLPFISVITEPIPQLWVSAEGDFLFKASLLDTVTKLVEAVKEHSSSLGPLVVPLLRESLSPGSIAQLDGDALNLWIGALRNTVTVASSDGSPCLRDVFPEAINLLATNLDLLGSITLIIESYFLLDAVHILKSSAVEIFRAYLSAFNNKIIELNAKDLLQSLSLLIQLAPSELWGEPLHVSGLFPHLLKTLIAGEGDTLFLTEHIYLFSRIIMSDRGMFLQLISASSAVLGQAESVIIDLLMDQWWGKFDNMSEPRHRKLTAMGIAVLVSTARVEVLARISGEIFNLWLDVFGELKEAEDQAALRQESDSEPPSPTNLHRFWELDKPPSSYFRETEGTPEYSRRQAVYDRDPIRVTQLVPFVGSQIREAEANCGPANFKSYLDHADPTVLKQIQDALARGQ